METMKHIRIAVMGLIGFIAVLTAVYAVYAYQKVNTLQSELKRVQSDLVRSEGVLEVTTESIQKANKRSSADAELRAESQKRVQKGVQDVQKIQKGTVDCRTDLADIPELARLRELGNAEISAAGSSGTSK